MKNLFFLFATTLIVTGSHVWQSQRISVASQALEQTQTEELQENAAASAAAASIDSLKAQIRDLKAQRRERQLTIDPEVVSFLATNSAPIRDAHDQMRLLKALGVSDPNSQYVLVTKSAVGDARFRAVQAPASGPRLTKAAAEILAISPAEQRRVEDAFQQAFAKDEQWASTNLVREEGHENMLVRYILPRDESFQDQVLKALFSEVTGTLGPEREAILEENFRYFRYDSDGRVAGYTNVLELYKINSPPGYGYRAGWLWDNSESVNTYPEPIRAKRFPAAFRFLFPREWEDLLGREQLAVPPEFLKGD